MPELVFVAVNVGVIPEIKLLLESLKVMVTVEEALPSATTGPVPVIVVVELEAVPAVKATVEVVVAEAPAGVTIARVFVSDRVEAKVQVEIPVIASLLVQALGFVLVVPVSVALKVGITLG